MTTQQSTIIYVPPNPNNISNDERQRETQDVFDLVTSLNTNKTNLTNKYNDKLKNIQNEFYTYRLDDEKLERDLLNEEKEQIKRDNDSYQKILLENTKKMQNVVSLITDLKSNQKDLMDNNRSYSRIQSLNGQHLAVNNIPNTSDYMIHVNNKCMSIDHTNTYSLQQCNSNNLSQKFTLEPVNDNSSYLAQFNIRAPSTEITSYPYNLVKSKLTGLCLEESNGNLSINKCSSLTGQKWRGMK